MNNVMRTLLLFAAVAVVACKTQQVRREALVPVPVVLPNEMCDDRGRVALSKGKPGERMICEMQEPLGSHVARCTCWDEGLLAEKRTDTQQLMLNITTGIQSCGNQPTCSGDSN
jgi:hypothetical protein